MVESKKIETVHSSLVTYASMISLHTLAPPFVNLLWYTMMKAMDGSILKTSDYLNNNGLQGFLNLWPKPTLLSF
ncbi:putative 7-dehydrocholesterol reductase [Medicago truncatula]|uniref:Putative 7-dehydrocholesterol reductase n=1 Tax=Medicago truncatula TaxID=3880 RepID=A0A396IB29_MEDTR|nr:putative 7-dehydrocholesterol reductase [Medicago truncatula]